MSHYVIYINLQRDQLSLISSRSFSIQWEELIWNTKILESSSWIQSPWLSLFDPQVLLPLLTEFPLKSPSPSRDGKLTTFKSNGVFFHTAVFWVSCPWANQYFSHALSTYHYCIVMFINQSPYLCWPILSYFLKPTLNFISSLKPSRTILPFSDIPPSSWTSQHLLTTKLWALF